MQSNKKEYKKPKLADHGDLKVVTLKRTGGIDGMGVGHQDSY